MVFGEEVAAEISLEVAPDGVVELSATGVRIINR